MKKKLVLNKRTIARLDEKDMNSINGGEPENTRVVISAATGAITSAWTGWMAGAMCFMQISEETCGPTVVCGS